MGLIEKLRGQRICLDTSPFIYFIEEHETYRNIVRPIFFEIDSVNIEAITRNGAEKIRYSPSGA